MLLNEVRAKKIFTQHLKITLKLSMDLKKTIFKLSTRKITEVNKKIYSADRKIYDMH